MDPISDDATMKAVLEEANTIAVIGMKSGESDDAYRIPAYMKEHGYRIIPINPKLSEVLDTEAYADLGKIPQELQPLDVINIFRATEHLPSHVEEILALSPRPRAVWTQLGIHHGPSAQKLREAGITVIQDRCIMVDHRRLFSDRTA